MTEPHRLPDGRLLRFAERVFDPGTVERVLRPAFLVIAVRLLRSRSSTTTTVSV